MAEKLDESKDLESTTVHIGRTAAVVKGGRRFSFSALVVVGDRHGNVGIGYGKAPGVPAAIEKAQKEARKKMQKVELQEGTLPHPVQARFGASRLTMLPAAPGTGVIAGGTVRAVLELAGVRDCLTKSFGSTNQRNLSRATLDGLLSLRHKRQIAEIRGVELDKTDVEERLELGRRYAPVSSGGPKAAAPKGLQPRAAGGRGGKKGKGQRGSEERPKQADAAGAETSAPEAQASGEQAAPQKPESESQE